MMRNQFKYFDIQVNGYAGVDLNSLELDQERLFDACKKLKDDGVEGILGTIITDEIGFMIKKIEQLTEMIDNNEFIKSIIKGIHIEGPFINPDDGFRGAHPLDHIIPSNLDLIKKLLDAGDGKVKLVTIAPECDKNYETIKYLASNNIIVSAGHSNASLDQLIASIDNGLRMYTHLGNGSPSLLPRHDNIINRVLAMKDKLFISFIADGIHIPTFALNNYLSIAGYDKCIIVTDAMAAASAPPGRYNVSHIEVEVGEDKIVREVGKENLAGSAITMAECDLLLKDKLAVDFHDRKKILSDNAINMLDNINSTS